MNAAVVAYKPEARGAVALIIREPMALAHDAGEAKASGYRRQVASGRLYRSNGAYLIASNDRDVADRYFNCARQRPEGRVESLGKIRVFVKETDELPVVVPKL